MATAVEPAPAFTYRVEDKRGELTIVVGGAIDEMSELRAPDARGRRVVIDAQGVERINSMGVRRWLDLMEELERQGAQVEFHRLPPELVTQASMIATFLGNGRVESFLSPWICPNCDHTLQQLHSLADPIPPAIRCPKCGSNMELDWDREAYLAFRQ